MAHKLHTCNAVLSANQDIPNARKSFSDNPSDSHYLILFAVVVLNSMTSWGF